MVFDILSKPGSKSEVSKVTDAAISNVNICKPEVPEKAQFLTDFSANTKAKPICLERQVLDDYNTLYFVKIERRNPKTSPFKVFFLQGRSSKYRVRIYFCPF